MGEEEAEYNNLAIKTIGTIDIDYLKSKTLLSKRNRFRLCLHKDTSHLTQEMIICFRGFNYLRPHKHIALRSESYHLIEGALDVYIIDEAGKVINKVCLEALTNTSPHNTNFFYRLSEPFYHFMVPKTNWTIYHEVFTGPWSKHEIQYAPFSPHEDDPELSIQNYVRYITESS